MTSLANPNTAQERRPAASRQDLSNAAAPPADPVIRAGLSQLGLSPRTMTSVFLKLSLPQSAKLQNVDFLARYPDLMTLELANNSIADASGLNHLPYVVSCDLSNNRLASFDLDTPPLNLQYLDLSRNQLSSLGQMDIHQHLQMLCVDRNLIRQISGLQQCAHLTHLSLVNNGITKIENLDNIPLRFLDLRHNRIRVLENLDTLTQLEELYLGFNDIGSLAGLSPNCVSLQRLDLESNYIVSTKDITVLTPLRWLHHLNLRGNPLTMGENTHRLLLLYELPRLTILNELPVSPEEKVAAVNLYEPPEEVIAVSNHVRAMHKFIREYVTINSARLQEFASQFRPIVVCGPAGVGKRTLTRRLREEFPHLFATAVSHTTRPPRPLEGNGVDYCFASREEVAQMASNGQFINVVNLFGHLYGLSYESVSKVQAQGKLCLISVELEGAQGAVALSRSELDLRFVFVAPPSLETLQDRLERRYQTTASGSTPVSIAHNQVQQWMQRAVDVSQQLNADGVVDNAIFEATIVNDNIDTAYATFRTFCLREFWMWYEQHRQWQQKVSWASPTVEPPPPLNQPRSARSSSVEGGLFVARQMESASAGSATMSSAASEACTAQSCGDEMVGGMAEAQHRRDSVSSLALSHAASVENGDYGMQHVKLLNYSTDSATRLPSSLDSFSVRDQRSSSSSFAL
ncbi:hypothetical protein RI367_007527 [Sorochytrium milnesiophthora]